MTERRALLTDRERAIVAGDADVEDSYRYQTISRVRARFGRLEEDLKALEKHGDLADELREIVCRAEGGQERGETPVEEPPGETDVDDTPRREDTHTPREIPQFADTVDAVAEDVLPGSGGKLEARREALHAAVDYLRERGQATPKDFRTDVYPEHPGHYTDGDDPARSWWKNCIYKGLREFADRTDLVEKADTTGEWTWRGESA
jgi:hypothetical protein